MNHYIERVVDLLDPATNDLYDLTTEQARALLVQHAADAMQQIEGSFALVARSGKMVRMVRSLDRPMRYFLAKRTEGPVLIVADRIAPRYHHPAPLQDVQRALRLVRSRAREWQVDPRRIGVWGFSAGGHLASTAATHFDDGKADADDAIERASCRPARCNACCRLVPCTISLSSPASSNAFANAGPGSRGPSVS